jgi:hypothetical protein
LDGVGTSGSVGGEIGRHDPAELGDAAAEVDRVEVVLEDPRRARGGVMGDLTLEELQQVSVRAAVSGMVIAALARGPEQADVAARRTAAGTARVSW